MYSINYAQFCQFGYLRYHIFIYDSLYMIVADFSRAILGVSILEYKP